MKKYVVCMILFSSAWAYSYENWLKARTVQELDQMMERGRNQEYLKTFCLLQLRKNKIPGACYQWMVQKKLVKERKSHLFSYLDERCQVALLKEPSLKSVNQALKIHELSSFCRKNLEKRREIMEYRLRDSAPSQLFHWYLKKEF